MTRVLVVPDDAHIIRAADVVSAAKEFGVRRAAERLGISPAYVSRVARGQRAGSVDGRRRAAG